MNFAWHPARQAAEYIRIARLPSRPAKHALPRPACGPDLPADDGALVSWRYVLMPVKCGASADVWSVPAAARKPKAADVDDATEVAANAAAAAPADDRPIGKRKRTAA